MEPKREPSVINPNPFDIDKATVEAVTEPANKDLASLIVLFHQYRKHHWLVHGPQHRDLHQFYEDAYETVNEAYEALAERLTSPGRIPVSIPVAAQRKSRIDHEEEGEFDVRDMIKRDVKATTTVISHLRDTISTAASHEDYATEHLLKDVIVDLEEIADELDDYLHPDSLEA